MKKPNPSRKWLRKVGFWVLALVTLLVIFHRPIVFEGTRYFVIRAAKQQKLDVHYTISGSIFSTLTISDLRVLPTESGPIQRLDVRELHLQYSLWGVIRHGLPALLKELVARDVFLELTPAESPPPEKQAEAQAFKFPALFPELLTLENINILIHGARGDLIVAALDLSLLPDRPGELKIATLDIPGVRKWTDLTAATTFSERKLVLTDLTLGPKMMLRSVNVDASQLNDAVLGLGLDGTLFGAETRLSAIITDLNATNHVRADLQITGLELAEVWDFLNLPPPAIGTLVALKTHFDGRPESPAEWVGAVDLKLDGLAIQSVALGETNLSVRLRDKQARLEFSQAISVANRLHATATLALPETLDALSRGPATGQIRANLSDLGTLTSALAAPITGALDATTAFELSDGKITADTNLTSTALGNDQATLNGVDFTLHVEKGFPTPADAPIFQGLSSRLLGGIQSVRLHDYSAEDIRLAMTSREAAVALETLSFRKGENTAEVTASATLPADMESFSAQPLRATIALNAPDLQAFLTPGAETAIRGELKIHGNMEAQNGFFGGDFVASGRAIEIDGFEVRSMDAKVSVADNLARITGLEIVMDDRNSLRATGSAELKHPFTYEGSLDVQLADLSRFQPLLVRSGITDAMGGSLIIAWQGRGTSDVLQQSGTASVTLAEGRFGDIAPLTASFSADYMSDYINVRDLRAGAGDLGNAAVSLFWQNNRLRLSNLSIRQRQLTLLEGTLDLPLVLAEISNIDRLIPNDQPVEIDLRVPELNLKTLFEQIDKKTAPATGTIRATLNASGTLAALTANATVRGTELRWSASKTLDPAEISIRSNLRDNALTLDAVLNQRLIEPLTLAARLPVDVPAIRAAQSIDPLTPVNVRIRLPRTSLATLNTLVPAIRQSRGSAGADIQIDGTLGKPLIRGSVEGQLEALRFTDPSLPPLDKVAMRVGFTGDRMRIDELRGRLAGGSFEARGGLEFANTTNPTLDFRFLSRNALVLQNDDLTVRVSTDLRVTGPLNAATVGGDVWVTKSRFFKDIDILPIGLPGRPAPQPPAEPDVVSFPDLPFRDWKFDVAIRTSDPFMVQSNLAKGRITMALRLGGTGLKPWLDGSVNVEQLTASLPFSRLQIESGLVYFTPDAPFVPRLNLRGTSTIRDYDLSVYIYGTATAPEAIFSSSPPLPQSEIVSLIATGTTTSELARDPNALAGRGAVLVFQKLYRQVFRRNKPPPENDSFLSRIQFDIGATDPKTGQQSASARVPLSDQIVLVGGVDVGGNFRGQVKYLIRFR